MKESNATAQRPEQLQAGPDTQVDMADVEFRTGVVGGFLVLWQRYLIGKGGWHLRPVGGHMPLLPLHQPELQNQSDGKGRDEQKRE